MTGDARKKDLNINTKIADDTGELSMLDEGKEIDEESSNSIADECGWLWPPISTHLQDIVNNMRSLCSSSPTYMDTTPRNDGFHAETSTDIGEPTALNSSMRTDDNNKIVFSTGELSMLNEGKKIDEESSKQVHETVNNMRSICSSTSSSMDIPPHSDAFHAQTSTDIGEPATYNSSMGVSNTDITSFSTWEKFTADSTRIKNALAQDYLRLLNTADKEVLKKLKGIGEKRATLILELREDSPELFKNLDDLKVIGLSAKQVKRWF
ncbi:hypothetical protein OIU84_007587 [Salix udensis]|uniref:Uncharacterized protein n=1 Tax=Salix udensis TaxID=889485 RepID=A0AAD6JTD7_9ROSI|nr:hypothetical protein OIU84_007587 [Salix udensis]KAJ6410859.1 hypothetical protein OIU84_007587 [Salix udensis]KAJ6410861.1 hypothetical protein OIU84_007587 [Salix udensis]